MVLTGDRRPIPNGAMSLPIAKQAIKSLVTKARIEELKKIPGYDDYVMSHFGDYMEIRLGELTKEVKL